MRWHEDTGTGKAKAPAAQRAFRSCGQYGPPGPVLTTAAGT